MVRLIVLALLTTGLAAQEQPPVPALGDLNPHVLAVVRSYPTDGTHRYHWPRSGTWKGCTRDLRYAGRLLCKGDPEGRAYCCGLTFEVFLRAFERWCDAEKRPFRIGDLDLAGVRRLQRQWFGSEEDPSCLHTALTANGLGVRITGGSKARPGDFVQLWRHDGSGHSVVFLRWERRKGRVAGITYWSVQRATRGIGRRTEWFGDEGHSLRRDRLWLCRVGRPPRGR